MRIPGNNLPDITPEAIPLSNPGNNFPDTNQQAITEPIPTNNFENPTPIPIDANSINPFDLFP